MDSAPTRLTFCTQNLRAKADRYEQRKSLLKKSLLSHNIDFLGVQEVQDTSHLSQLLTNKPKQPFYLDNLKESTFTLLQAPLQRPICGGQLLITQNAICYNPSYQAIKHEYLHLSRCRNVQRALFQIHGKKVWFVNTHLHHLVEDEKIRHFQTIDILEWMKDVSFDIIMVVGDLNTPPYESGYSLWKESGFRSCFQEVNGAEPGKTFPTGIWAEGMDTGSSLTTDYILVKGEGITIKECKLISYEGIQTSDPYQAIYPSDHYGIVAVCEIQ